MLPNLLDCLDRRLSRNKHTAGTASKRLQLSRRQCGPRYRQEHCWTSQQWHPLGDGIIGTLDLLLEVPNQPHPFL